MGQIRIESGCPDYYCQLNLGDVEISTLPVQQYEFAFGQIRRNILQKHSFFELNYNLTIMKALRLIYFCFNKYLSRETISLILNKLRSQTCKRGGGHEGACLVVSWDNHARLSRAQCMPASALYSICKQSARTYCKYWTYCNTVKQAWGQIPTSVSVPQVN